MNPQDHSRNIAGIYLPGPYIPFILGFKARCSISINLSHILNSIKGGIEGIKWGTTIGVIKGDTRISDYSSLVFRSAPAGASSWQT